LKKMGPKAKAAIPDLLEACKSKDAEVRRVAILAAGSVDRKDKTVIATALALLTDADENVRIHAAARLTEMPLEAGSVPALIEALKDLNSTVRDHAALCLGNLGPEAVAAIPALRQLVNDPEGRRSGAVA